MGAAGVRPQIGRVVFAQSTALKQNCVIAHHKHRHRFMAQPNKVRMQFFNRL
jgi:hypothetical protein